MALNWYARHMLPVPCCKEVRRNKDTIDVEVVSIDVHSVSAVHQQHLESVVRIVLAGGIVELYSAAVPAYLVMEKHPGLCVARPEVFKKPHESLVGPKERLLPGQKFYLVPRSTVTKLRRKNPCRLRGDGDAKETVLDKVEGEEGDGVSEESVCSAKDFYVSKEKWSDCLSKRFENGVEREIQKPFMPPIKRPERCRLGLLAGWKPSLASVKELSP
ncbi:uncharacterized protein LOC120108045 [Phoenix dactylifera]|uniref:Uncharacterized protein LOC120108045 n=1 Tax=Phoenix dactylifera TaxID=42345 RepID=A0A8B9A2A4_PHODC|nr:uncharacterized protein LOC120108045 [Phoenix dactylifera]